LGGRGGLEERNKSADKEIENKAMRSKKASPPPPPPHISRIIRSRTIPVKREKKGRKS